MSNSHGKIKKDEEAQCLQAAIDSLKRQKGRSKKIIELMNGTEILRPNPERPDFVRRTIATSEQKENILLGIEHFRVDHLSLLKKDGKKVASIGMLINKEKQAIYEKYHPIFASDSISDEITETAGKEIFDLAMKDMSARYNANYNTLLKSFRYSVSSHIKNVECYRKALKGFAKSNEKIKLAFLIDIHAEFGNLILKNKHGIRRCAMAEVPFFEDFINILQEEAYKKIDYIVLCFNNTMADKPPKVIALSANQIQKDIERQHIPIYKYISADQSLPEFKGKPIAMNFKCTSVSKNKTCDKIDTLTLVDSKSLSPKTMQEIMLNSAYRISMCDEYNISYATTPIEKSFAEALKPEVFRWKHVSDKDYGKVHPIFKSYDPMLQSRINNRMDEMRQQFEEYGQEEFNKQGIIME